MQTFDDGIFQWYNMLNLECKIDKIPLTVNIKIQVHYFQSNAHNIWFRNQTL